MSGTYCQNNTTCPNGTCCGCKNGKIDCSDPCCSPNCPGCQMKPSHDNVGNIITIIILICLAAILFIVWFIYGPKLFEPHSDHTRAGVIVPEEQTSEKSSVINAHTYSKSNIISHT